MPLPSGYSKEAISKKISECMENSDRGKKQCTAIAYSDARKEFRKAHPDKPLPTYLRKASKRK